MRKVKYIQPVKCHVKKDTDIRIPEIENMETEPILPIEPENLAKAENSTEPEIPIHLYNTPKAKALDLEELRDAYYESDIGLHIYIRERDEFIGDFNNFAIPALLDELYGSTLIAIWAYDSYYYEKDYGRTWIAYLNNPF